MPTVTNYYTGIDLVIDGTEGVDYAIERHWHNEVEHDTKVLFVKPGTQFGFTHNARNKYGSSVTLVPPVPTPGRIRYKIDRDLQHMGMNQWSTGGVLPELADGARIAFEDLEYEPGVAVLGTTGPKPGVLRSFATKSSYYWRGIVGAFGEERHTVTVADDDSQFVTAEGYRASDGKVLHYVCGATGPEIPSLEITSTGNAQWFTTDPKAYHIPKTVAQKTYFAPGTGTVSFTIRDIGGNNVFYRIVDSLEDVAAYTAAGASSVTLDQDDFTDGVKYLQYYFTGGLVAYRRIEKNPAHPSAGETHGRLLWGPTRDIDDIKPLLTASPFTTLWTNLRTNDSFGSIAVWDTHGNQGKRLGGPNALENAFVAAASTPAWTTVKPGKVKSWALYAKEKLIQQSTNIDHVGFELTMSGSDIPSRSELNDRGYRDYFGTLMPALAYDLMIGEFISATYADGFTPIEDLHVRERLACGAHNAMMWMGGYTEQSPGMWGYSRNVGGLAVALALPTYSSELYGTSGIDGTAAEFFDTPFPDVKLTWKQVFADPYALPLGMYPNLHYNDSLRRLGTATHPTYGDNHWADKASYFEWGTCNSPIQVFMNLLYVNLGIRVPDLEALCLRCVSGTMRANLADSGLAAWSTEYRKTLITLYNDNFPEIVGAGMAWSQGLTTGSYTVGATLNDARIFGIAWYNPDATGEIVTSAPEFSTHPASQTVDEGDPATLTVVVTGTPTPTIAWYKDGAPIPNDGATLYIPSTTLADAGAYHVIATNSVAATSSNTATLTVNAFAPAPSGVRKRNTLRTPTPTASLFGF